MRHNVKGRKLKRTASHKEALLRNLASALFVHKRIETTLAKAKELRTFVEPLITKAKVGDLHRKRLIMNVIKSREACKELFGTIAEATAERKGGYTRVVKTGRRLGDAAEMAFIELVDFNAIINDQKKALKDARDEAKEAAAKEKQQANAATASANS